ncbi:hypothetical protein D1007_03198 [Hordeum vulgare]|uniref:Uncharacterized protein n=1 Tax=Hordeum vulgare subsp. vulgare TaxID=112509 RepID=A0A8I6YMF8_HORVV|nr:uncharacterized protein LOC123403205 [Hordeum vulgare subsp. vulgare]KAE8818993.1 hypothetical protein D1007_03198 [Hordeum vulgare]
MFSSQEGSQEEDTADFSFKDGNRLCSLFLRQQGLIKKKRRWLASLNPELGVPFKLKRPKFLKVVYLAESDVRTDEVSSERVRFNVEESFGLQRKCYIHHEVLDGLELFKLQKQKDGSLCPESWKIMHCTISKLSNEALESVANIVAHNGINFRKIRPTMIKIVKDHLPKYLAELDSETGMRLSEILTNPCSYRSNSLRLRTPVSPMLLSSIDQALAGLDEIPQQAAIAINRKLTGKSCPPEFLHVARTSSRSHLINLIRKRCGNMIAKLQEGKDLPKNFAKALSVMNLHRKLTLRSIDISQSEFFPFPRATISLQQDILNALWSLPNVDTDDMKLLRRITGQGSEVKMASFKAAVRRYLTECLFECDDGNLPDLAVRAIGFLARLSPKCQQAILTEERKEVEVDAVLDLSSCLRSLARGATEENSSDDEVSLESDRCSEDNDFVLASNNYFDVRSQQHMDEGCSSNFMINSNEDSEYTDGAGHDGDSEAAGSMKDPSLEKDNVEMTRYSEEDLSALCDDTASIAHELIGHILKNMLTEDEVVDELTGCYLGGSSNSQDPKDPEAKNQKDDIVMNAVQSLLPNLPKSSIDKVRSILDGAEQ